MNAPLLPGSIEHWPLARLKPYARNAKTHGTVHVVARLRYTGRGRQRKPDADHGELTENGLEHMHLLVKQIGCNCQPLDALTRHMPERMARKPI